MKKTLTLTILGLIILVSISGCLNLDRLFQGDSEFCKEIEKEAEKEGYKCRCIMSGAVPEKLKGKDVKPKCFCKCIINGTLTNFSIIQSPEVRSQINP